MHLTLILKIQLKCILLLTILLYLKIQNQNVHVGIDLGTLLQMDRRMKY